MELQPKRRKYSASYCPHCKTNVSKSTWYRHYADFYNVESESWEDNKPDEPDFNFSSEDEDTSAPVASSASSFQFDDDDASSNVYCGDENGGDGDNVNAIEVWESEDSDEDSAVTTEQLQTVSSTDNNYIKLINFICMFLLAWQALFRIPDVAAGLVFKFMSILLKKLALTSTQTLTKVQEFFPDNLKKAHAMQSINTNNFSQLIVCPKCCSTYEQADFTSRQEIATCSYVRFPRHPHQNMRSKCGEKLMKAVKTAKKNRILVPLKVFCYNSIIDTIKDLVQRPGILDIFSEWKLRKIPEGVMCDIYDGELWKSFLYTADQEELLSSRYTLGLLLNVDWFQPYKHVQYSTGAIYISFLNFPRSLRYCNGNTFVVGLLPGPHEPKLHMNSFLENIVRELLLLWKGVRMQTPEGEKEIKAVLLCVACDTPASRKIGGFMGHAALKGCSRCLKSFPTKNFGEKSDYSGFNRSSWEPRSLAEHRKQGLSWKHATTLSQRKNIERQHGVRFTELLRLPYFDTVRCVAVDPMHNMLLGTAKLMVNLWKDDNIFLTDFGSIQDIVDKFITPAGIGRIPHKIAANFSSFTADQWKNWVLIYSIVVLKTQIPNEHYACWCIFADACSLLCSRAITKDNVTKMDSLIIKFCYKFQQLYGDGACTPNLHLHCHLKDCFLDFGPAGAFWTFAFERLNGILGSYPTNHRAIEVQLMRKFSVSQQVMQVMKREDGLHELFSPFQGSVGSLKQNALPELPLPSENSIEKSNEACRLLPPVKESCLNADEHSLIESTLRHHFSQTYARTLLIHKCSRAIEFSGDLYGSLNSIHSSSAMIFAKPNTSSPPIPAFARKYLKVAILLTTPSGESRSIVVHLVALNWLQPHPERNWFHSPVEVWSKHIPDVAPEAFVPVTNIVCRCAYLEDTIKFNQILQEKVTVVVPVYNFVGLS